MSILQLPFTPLFAHAFGVRYDLPIPLFLFLVAGAGVVFLSFLLVMRRKVDDNKHVATPDLTHISKYNWVASAFSIAGLILIMLAGFVGSQTVSENIVSTLFWLVVWIAVPLSCGLIGDWTQSINPFANISKLFDSRQLRTLLFGRDLPLAWPSWLAWWFATVLYFALACGELIFNQMATLPGIIAVGLLVYSGINIVMSVSFGQAWLVRGEIFTVLFSTWGRLGFFRFGAVGNKGYAGGLAIPFEASVSRIFFILLLLVSVSFDGLLATPTWSRLQHLLPTSIGTGTLSFELLITIAFAFLALFIWALFSLFAVAVSKAGEHSSSPQQALAGLLPSLLPIAFGYLLAHNFQYLVVNSQLLFPLLGNPIGTDSWPFHLVYPFNDTFEPNIHILSSATYWYIAVAVIVVVHIIAVVVAHQHLGSATKNEIKAQQSEYPWVGAMVAYTMLSLWLLAQPLVQEAPKTTGRAVPPTNYTEVTQSGSIQPTLFEQL